MKGNAFTYNVDASRMMHTRASSAVSPLGVPANAYHDGLTLPANRVESAAGYGDRPYYTPSAWSGEYGGTGVDYTICQPAFPASASGSSFVTGAYAMTANNTSVKADGMLYLDAGAAYGYAAVPTGAASVSRQSPGSETGFPYQTATPGLSSSVNSSNERLPPTPSRTLPSSGPSAYRGEDYRKSSHLAAGDVASGLGIDVSAGYQAYDNAPLSYGSQVGGQLGRSADLYTNQSPDATHEGSLRPQVHGEAEPPFRYADGAAHRDAPGSLTGGQYYLYHRQGQHGDCALSTDLVSGSASDAAAKIQKSPARNR